MEIKLSYVLVGSCDVAVIQNAMAELVITASSEESGWPKESVLLNARPSGSVNGAWSPLTSDPDPWIMVRLIRQ